MQSLSHRVARPLLALGLLTGAAGMSFAQEAPAPAEAQATVTLTAAERERYVGVYELESPDGVLAIHVFVDGENLMGRPENADEPSVLTPLGEHRFRPVLEPTAVVRFTLEGDRAINMAIEFADERGTMLAFRKP